MARKATCTMRTWPSGNSPSSLMHMTAISATTMGRRKTSHLSSVRLGRAGQPWHKTLWQLRIRTRRQRKREVASVGV